MLMIFTFYTFLICFCNIFVIVQLHYAVSIQVITSTFLPSFRLYYIHHQHLPSFCKYYTSMPSHQCILALTISKQQLYVFCFPDSNLLADVAYILCLDSLGAGNSLHLHVSKPPREDKDGGLFLKVSIYLDP